MQQTRTALAGVVIAGGQGRVDGGALGVRLTDIADTGANITEAPSRDYDVARFYGSPKRALELLGWWPKVSLKEGLSRLVADFRIELASKSRKVGGS